MPAFVKNPKFIIGTIVVLWLVYVIEEAFKTPPVSVKLIPFAATVDFRVSAIIIASVIFGSIATLVIQFFWRRRSKNASSVPPVSSSTMP